MNNWVRSIYTKTVRSIRARAPMPPSPYASQTPVKLDDGSLIFNLKERLPSTENCPVIPCKMGRVLSPTEQVNLTISNKNTLSKLAKELNLSRSFIISRQSPEKREQLRAEEQARIDKLSVRQKKGLLIRRMIRIDRFKSF